MDEAQANERAQSAQSIKEECNLELAKAIPILDAAVAALNILTNNVRKKALLNSFKCCT